MVDEFTIPVNLNTRTTTVQTDQIFLGEAPAAPEEEPAEEPSPADDETPSEEATPTDEATPAEEPTSPEETTPTEEVEESVEPSEEASPTEEETPAESEQETPAPEEAPAPPTPVAQCEISGGTWDELDWEAASGDLSEETTGQLELLSDEAAPGTAVEGVLSAEAAANCSELVAAVFPGGAGTDEPGLPVEISAVWEDGSIVFELPDEEDLPAGQAALAVYSTEGDTLGWATLEILSPDEFPEAEEIIRP
ncbi:hypothetical protein HGQ17_10055 [Nesterenkonia sp. MY13]|uniref:Uncharacterized protein n=1 Tax=Nesterenkonia sedimenti TaxID=1463632 RepID=A0A7X8YE73_9MICC|nr:hypothetical protein [Nesterenkonia sedimenti]NLS10329.1 hypothetical protein [Nesterenkonia sedimenti]